jgi:hypothetical protein
MFAVVKCMTPVPPVSHLRIMLVVMEDEIRFRKRTLRVQLFQIHAAVLSRTYLFKQLSCSFIRSF